MTPLTITVEQLVLLDTDTLEPTDTELDPSPELLTTTFDPSPEPTVTVEEDDVLEDALVVEDEDVLVLAGVGAGFHVRWGAGGGLLL